DGSLGSHTAALSAPYADEPGTRGHLWHGVEELAEHIAACTRAGVQAGFHAIGDAALRTVLEAMDKAAGQVGLDALVAARHRVEHAEMPPAEGVTAGPGEASGAFAVGGPGDPAPADPAGGGPAGLGGITGTPGPGGVADFARFGLVASVQPAFDALWGGPD